MSARLPAPPHLLQLGASPGADIEQEPTTSTSSTRTVAAVSSAAADRSADIPTTNTGLRGKVNEIDFCIAPADVSLSRAYSSSSSSIPTSSIDDTTTSTAGMVGLSLTRALNTASNRAVRRILLARSWPSAEALNESLRQVAALEAARESSSNSESENESTDPGASGKKCPVPRPILNVLTRNQRRQQQPNSLDDSSTAESPPSSTSRIFTTTPQPRSRTDAEYVADQLQSFRQQYGTLPGYPYAQDYLECILSLATSGVESSRARDVLQSNVYDEAYKRVLAVLRTVGVTYERDAPTGRMRIAARLKDQDICWSVLDKIQFQKEAQQQQQPSDSMVAATENGSVALEGMVETAAVSPAVATESESVAAEGMAETASVLPGVDRDEPTTSPIEEQDSAEIFTEEQSESNAELPPSSSETRDNTNSQQNDGVATKKGSGLQFWKRSNGEKALSNSMTTTTTAAPWTRRDDLGGVLLSAEEPTVTRQLNVLSNIVQRALLFGSDQELLVLAETLDADRTAFIERWYPGTNRISSDAAASGEGPGLRYLDCLIQLLRECYTKGVVTDLNPPFKLSTAYANAYERLVASSVELGSGYLKPTFGSGAITGAGVSDFAAMPKPRTAQEELGRFAVLETKFRAQQQSSRSTSTSTPSSLLQFSPYPLDLVGSWQVRDEIGGETIGTSTVEFLEQGNVQVAPPLEGLRWRLDPGPTHLDTCTFQVLSTLDGTILQYRGFIDRGARLEARFSKRLIKIRGSVQFQMRDGASSVDYYKDMLPINYRSGTTKFVMTKLS